jgi:aconitase B
MNYLKYHMNGNKRLELLIPTCSQCYGRQNKILKKDFVFSKYYDVINNSIIIITISWILFSYM